MLNALIVFIAVVLDYLLGEPRRGHPLAMFGRWVSWWEAHLYGSNELDSRQRQLRGIVCWVLVILPFLLVSFLLIYLPALNVVAAIVLLYLAIGGQSLLQHARQVSHALQHNELQLAQQRVAMMVSRDTTNLDPAAINRATIESVLENGNDAIFGAIFWFLLLGIPGVVLYRLANTLDAMWGYKNERYLYFGRFAARVDDVMNWLPARLTALTYALMGHTRQALSCWRSQAANWKGINPGVVMAAGAGALLISLGGTASYHGQLVERPQLGVGNAPEWMDIERALALVQRSQWCWVITLLVGGWIIA